MPTDSNRLGSLILLDYGQNHKEHSLTIFDPNWTSIIDFFTDPHGYLTQAQTHWQNPSGINWTLETPAIAYVKGAMADYGTIAQWLQLFARLGWSAPMLNADNYTYDQLIADIWEASPARHGCFMIDFAIETAALSVTYLPPFACQDAAPARRHYRGGFSPVTVNHSTGIPAEHTGIDVLVDSMIKVHVDMNPPGPHHPETAAKTQAHNRACMITDLLENRQWFVDLLNGEVHNIEFKWHPEGTPMTIDPASSYGHPACQFVLPKNAQDARQIGSPKYDLPTLVVEDLQASPSTDTCVPTNASRVGREYALFDMMIKSYKAPAS